MKLMLDLIIKMWYRLDEKNLDHVFQECGPVLCWGLFPVHGFSLLLAAWFVSGNLRDAGEGDRHHCVWSVLGL